MGLSLNILGKKGRERIVIILRGGTGMCKTPFARELCGAYGGVLCSRANVWNELAGGEKDTYDEWRDAVDRGERLVVVDGRHANV